MGIQRHRLIHLLFHQTSLLGLEAGLVTKPDNFHWDTVPQFTGNKLRLHPGNTLKHLNKPVA